MSDAKQTVLEAMRNAGKPVRPGDVATATGLEKDVVSKAIKQLKADGDIHSPKRCFYAPGPQ